MIENDRPKVILYARVSTDEQAKTGYSLREQLEALADYAASEGYEVLEPVEDPGKSGAYLDRPGLDRVRALVEAGGVYAVIAQDRDRLAREPAHLYILREEFAAHGTALRALNNRGDDSPEGQLTDGILDQLAKFEREKIRERTMRGKRKKAREGSLVGVSPRPRYGFAYNAARTGYVPDPETMPTVLRIFGMLSEGYTLASVALALDQSGVKTPKGSTPDNPNPKWSRATLREMALDDTYLPHTVAELADKAKLTPAVIAALDKDGLYGIAYSGRVRIRKVSNSRRRKERPNRSEWIGVPIRLDGSGLDASTVQRARKAIEGNRRPAKVWNRDFELSGGIVRCWHCNRAMTSYSRQRKDGRAYFYRCDGAARKREGTDCPNRKSRSADKLEQEAWIIFGNATDPEKLTALYNERERRYYDGEEKGKRQTLLVERMALLTRKRAGFQDQQAEGLMTLDELRERLTDLDEERRLVSAELETLRDAATRKEQTDAMLAAFFEWRKEGDFFYNDSPEERRRAYSRLGARFTVDEDGILRLRLELDLSGNRCTASGSS